MNPAELIAAGPSTPAEVASKAAAITAEAPVSHQISDNTSVKNVLAAFSEVKNKENNPDETHLKALLEEEKQADSREDSGEDIQKGDEGSKSPVQEAKETLPSKTESKEVPATPKLGTIPKSPAINYAEELKALGLTESSQQLFKQMANPAKEFVIAELKRSRKEVEEHKAKVEELQNAKPQEKDGLPQNWYEHEEAYLITPEYKKLSGTRNTVANIEDHYRKQLIAIKEGEDWFDLVLNKDGSIGQVKQKASSTADAMVMTRINEAFTERRKLEDQEAQLAQSFKQNSFNHKAGIQKVEDEYFPQYADRKAFENNNDAKAMRAVLQSSGLHNDRMAGITSRLYAFAMEQVRKVEELEKTASVAKPTTKNGPTGDEINAGTSAITKKLAIEDRPFMASAFDAYHKQ